MAERQRIRLEISGAVQGVGFRPFVYRLATEMGLSGWVNNSAQGVAVEVEGEPCQLQMFRQRLEQDKPALSLIQHIKMVAASPLGEKGFSIHTSSQNGKVAALVLPDIATCPDCLNEIFDAGDRRSDYAFTNCTNCGPRYTIIEALPYDRPQTTMKHFAMCPACHTEYETPTDRRFHAQPNACPVCGPHLELWDQDGNLLATHEAALESATNRIRAGKIAAVKGVGGFHLIADARNGETIKRLRQHKHREEKPFAVMLPSLEMARQFCEVSGLEARLLTAPEAPIVLLRRKPGIAAIAAEVAPDNPYLGVMLPYTPLHHLLLTELGFPIVATSGNLSDEPICTDELEALGRLHTLADVFLVHNRPILRHVDDSVVHVVDGRETILRRARGYAPLPIRVETGQRLPPILAVGAHLKNTVAISKGDQIFISQHIGDLETAQSYAAFQTTIRDFQRLFDFQPGFVACDMHPDYLSTQFARTLDVPCIPVQHHYAHVLACMADNALTSPALGIAWDGTGWGPDGTIWGGEFLRVDEKSYTRAAHFRAFPLPGGEAAIKEPCRAALGLLYEMYGAAVFEMSLPLWRYFTPQSLPVYRQMLAKKVNCPVTTSAGRIFDAVAALTGLRDVTNFEGQGAMLLEFAAVLGECESFYDFAMTGDGVVDWQPMIEGILIDLRKESPVDLIAAKFHNTLVEIIVNAAQQIGETAVALTGGCFQNRYLTERAVRRLRQAGFRPYWHHRIPPNDGGIVVGQILAAARYLQEETGCA